MFDGQGASLTESQAIRLLAAERWQRRGASLESVNVYSAEAVRQYVMAVSQEVRDRLKLRAEMPGGSETHGGRRLVMKAEEAARVFQEKGCAMSNVMQSPSAIER